MQWTPPQCRLTQCRPTSCRLTGCCAWLAALVVVVCGEVETLRAAPTDVVINEILYHPDPDNSGGEFAEVFNRGDTAVDLSGWSLTQAISFTFAAGTTLESGAYLVVARRPEDAKAFYSNAANAAAVIVGPFEGRLGNSGESLVLQDGNEQEIDSVSYDDQPPWPAEADGGGPSLELVDPASDNSRPESWGLGQSFSPGAPNAPVEPGGGAIVITEIMYKPLRQEIRVQLGSTVNGPGPYTETDDDTYGEFVEIFNRTQAVVDLSGWTFSEGIEFVFPEGTTLEPGAYLAVAGSPDFLKTRQVIDNVVGPFTGQLRNGGERLTLRDRDSNIVDSLRYDDRYPWPTAPDEFGASLECVAPDEDNSTAVNWRASAKAIPPAGPIFAEAETGDDDGWQFVEAITASNGDSWLLAVFSQGVSEWLIDEVELRLVDGGENAISNGTFDEGDAGWEKLRDHAETFWSSEETKAGTGAEHLVSTGAGSLANSLRIRLFGLESSGTYRLTAWVKHLSGHPLLSVIGVGAEELNRTVTGGQFDLSTDWSQTDNPNVLWEYRDGDGELITGQASNWLEADLGPGQTAWAAGDAETPGWCKSSGSASPALDFPAGTVGAHSPAQVWWRSPGYGRVTIGGGVYLLQHAGRDQTWEIRHTHEGNTQTLTSGALISGQTELNSANPVSFESGTDGAEALTVTVAEGDTIALVVRGNEDQGHDFVGVLLTVSARFGRAPEPPLSGAIGSASPGRENSVSADLPPPFVETVQHFPFQPTSSDTVTVSALVTTSGAPLRSVELGREILRDTSRETVDLVPMFDDGAHNDAEANDGVYGAQVAPEASQTLVHYWVRAEDNDGRVTVFPYDGDPSPSLAYFHYDDEIDTNMTLCHLFMAPEHLEQLNREPRGEDYFDCSIVIDDRRPGRERQGPIAYPHIRARHRGALSRLDPRHQWKLKFNKFQLYDGNRILDTSFDPVLVEKMAYLVFDRAGIENLESEPLRLHLNGQFWEYYLGFESPNSTWAAKHDYGGGTEVYKARSHSTPNQAKNSDLYRNQMFTDDDFWGAWNKKIRPLEPPVHIMELTDVVNDLPDDELLPWLDANVDLEQIYSRWGINILLNIDDFTTHNHMLFRPEGGTWKMLGFDFDTLGRDLVGNLQITYGDGRGGSSDWQWNKLLNRSSTNRTLRRIHILNLRRMMSTFFTEEILFPLLDAEEARADPEARRGAGAHVKSHATLQIGLISSAIEREELPGQEEIPTIDPPGGQLSGPTFVTLSTPKGWRAVSTVDGTDPRLSTSAVVYSGPIAIAGTTTLRVASIAESTDDGEPDFRRGNWTDLAEEHYDLETTGAVFLRGDCDGNGRFGGSPTEAIVGLNFSFRGGPAPPCLAACDAEANGTLGITDYLRILRAAFLGQGQPDPPFPDCTTSNLPSDGELGCERPFCLP